MRGGGLGAGGGELLRERRLALVRTRTRRLRVRLVGWVCSRDRASFRLRGQGAEADALKNF